MNVIFRVLFLGCRVCKSIALLGLNYFWNFFDVFLYYFRFERNCFFNILVIFFF